MLECNLEANSSFPIEFKTLKIYIMDLDYYFAQYPSLLRLRDAFEQEDWIDDEDLLGMMKAVLDYRDNVGYQFKRIEENEREKAFFEEWLHENEPRPGVNNGNGILQDLFIERVDPYSRKWVEHIQPRDRMIVATVIQWLGSNVGMSFLHAALKRFGAHIVYDKTEGGQNV